MASYEASDFGSDLSIAHLETTPQLRHNTSDKNIEEARAEFEAFVGKEAISDVPEALKAHSSTAWSPSPTNRTASLIIYPSSTSDVSEILKICHRRYIPVTPFTGGTSFDGALAATRGGICLDLSRMNRVIAIHDRDLDAVVQAGVGWQELNKELAPLNLFFPVDPGPGAAIGGMVATNCSGTNAYRYGTMKDWVLSTTVVLADGTVVKTRHRPRKSSAGFDLTRLIVGSSGTLGVVTEATVKVTALPKNVQVAVVTFPAVKDAVNSVVELVQHEQQLAAMELLDAPAMRAIEKLKISNRKWAPEPTMFFKFSGSPRTVKEQIEFVQEVTARNGRRSFDVSTSQKEIDELWAGRKMALMALIGTKPDPTYQLVTADAAVPISRLADIIEEAYDMINASGFWGSNIGHVGDGMKLWPASSLCSHNS